MLSDAHIDSNCNLPSSGPLAVLNIIVPGSCAQSNTVRIETGLGES